MRFVSAAVQACTGSFGYSSKMFSKRMAKLGSKLVASVASFSVAFMPIATSFIPQHAYAQQIIIDPSAPSTSLFTSGNCHLALKCKNAVVLVGFSTLI